MFIQRSLVNKKLKERSMGVGVFPEGKLLIKGDIDRHKREITH